ncbi:hypothetical protein ACIBL3_46100 [Kribbella sp. NPDC050124]|uniref:hypothetical protein n=1 Tax=Kribbella sp. NPDC050124 TaxID=3364114 RepID=UPI0037BB8063
MSGPGPVFFAILAAAGVVLSWITVDEFSFVSSNDNLDLDPAAAGETVELMVDPLAPDRNMLLEDFNAEWNGSFSGLASRLIVPTGITIIGCVLGVRAYRLGRPWGGIAGAASRIRARIRSLAEPWR